MSPKRKQAKPRKRKVGTIVIKIPVTVDTLTGAMLLIQELLKLARIVKLPLETEKVEPA